MKPPTVSKDDSMCGKRVNTFKCVSSMPDKALELTTEYSCLNRVRYGNGRKPNLNLKDVLKFYSSKVTDGY
jgi:hypothetical protein